MDTFLYLAHLPNRYLNLIEKKFSTHATLSSQEVLSYCHELQRIDSAPENPVELALSEAVLSEKICQKEGYRVTHFWKSDYPQKLKQIENPPLVLFYLGNLPQEQKTLSVVGSRFPDAYAAKTVSHVFSKLTTRPIQMISGLAFGVDSLAHTWACEVDIPNWAILGSGLDQIYPEQNRNLAKRILKSNGGILSEFAPQASPRPFHFPRRNRIISGLCDVLWVVQGTLKSGTRHTIDYACKHGKTVAATPGDIFNPLSEVPNRLILEGAHCIVSPLDLDILLA